MKKLKLKSSNTQFKSKQTIENIEVLDPMLAIRRRVSYYLGSNGSDGVFQIWAEIFQNACDEFNEGRNTFVGSYIDENNQITIWDKGGGIPIDIYPQTKQPVIVDLFTKLHSGGKLGGGAYSSAKGTVGCFVGSTRIRLNDGSSLPIEEFAKKWEQNGLLFRVNSFNIENNKNTTNMAYGIINTRTVQNLEKIILDNNLEIICTPDHPFLLSSGTYLEASKLQISQALKGLHHDHYVKSIESFVSKEPVKVYGMTVKGDHNYLLDAGVFVGNTHGVGQKATNALSSSLEIWTYRNNKWYNLLFKKGQLINKLNTQTPPPTLPIKIQQGTIIRFTPDFSAFDEGSKLSLKKIKEYCALQAFTHAGLKIFLKTPKNEYNFYEKEGLKALLQKQISTLGEEAEELGKPFVLYEGPVDLAISWTKYSGELLTSYVSGSNTKDGGTHVDGLYNAIRDALKPFKIKHEFTPAEARDGIIGIMNVAVMQPKFSSQSKERLEDKLVTDKVYDIVKPALDNYFAKNKSLVKIILTKASELHKRTAKFTADKKSIAQLKSVEGRLMLPSKLLNCRSKDIEKRELFAVEGESAGSTAAIARDKEYQMVLKLKGKVLNAYKNTEKLFSNEEVQSILRAIGYNDPNNPNAIDKLQTGKIIVLTDPDVDGPLHADTSILTLDGENPTIKQLAEEFDAGKPSRLVYSKDIYDNIVTSYAVGARLAVETKHASIIYFSDGSFVECTNDHAWSLLNLNQKQFVYRNRCYVHTCDLKPNDLIVAKNEITNEISFKSVSFIKNVTYKTPQPYYCLSVPEHGNFFVNDGKGNGILSKNSHITNLLLSLFQKVLPETFVKEKIFVVDSPLFNCKLSNGNRIYGSSYEDVVSQLNKLKKPIPPDGIQRIKGWGEVSAEVLEEVAFNKKTRKLTKISAPNKKELQEFVSIVGEDASERRKLLGC